MTLGEHLVRLLERYGVRHVFGIPGVHTAELYRGLHGSAIRHITPCHEQGAGFMADGYARVTGRPGVCFVITGPGVTNIATAMAQAYADSIPMLVISGVAATADLGHPIGRLHELPDQGGLAAKLSAFSHTLQRPDELPDVLARAFRLFAEERPRPVHIEIPLDLMGRTVAADLADPELIAPRAAPPEGLRDAARLLQGAAKPVILAGGGVRRSLSSVAELAERLDAPVVMTVNGRGLLPLGHALAVPASPSLDAVRRLIAGADVVLAAGTELGPTDYDMYVRGGFAIPGRLIRIDLDAGQRGLGPEPELFLRGDAGLSLAGLARLIEPQTRARTGAGRAAEARGAAFHELSPATRRKIEILQAIRDALPGAAIIGDSTQAVYAGNLYFEPDAPGGWINSATGYGTLGYALPAAVGAKLGAPERPVVCLAGDGGIQFTIGELGSAMDTGTPIIVLVWNNRGYGEIKSYMEERGIAPEGVDLFTPDFCALARAYGWAAERLESAGDLPRLLRDAASRPGPTLIEMDEADMMA